MPNVNIYLPTKLFIKLEGEKEKSKLIQKLLNEYYEKQEGGKK
jgi:hypothetical protein